MGDEDKFSSNEDLLEYEKEVELKDEAPLTSLITKKTAHQMSDTEKYIDTKAFVVHGIPSQRPMADAI
ncbi:hypothetical protein BGX38DRAFT_1274759 [Terfezia claveryi]|nr:hypothetical protein BGX38DRAFT_1274759 [Terfezia claveryi]